MCPGLTTGTIRGTRGASRKVLAFEKMAKFALRKAISTSPATSELRPEKIMSHNLDIQWARSVVRSDLPFVRVLGLTASNAQLRSIFYRLTLRKLLQLPLPVADVERVGE